MGTPGTGRAFGVFVAIGNKKKGTHLNTYYFDLSKVEQIFILIAHVYCLFLQPLYQCSCGANNVLN